MARLIGFFVLVVVISSLLGHVPWIGPLFRSTGCIGIWLTAMALSWALTWAGHRAYLMKKDSAEIQRLEAVDSPYNPGKIGALLLAQGRTRKALPYLERAAAGEPDVAEWHYRLGTALLALGRGADAALALERAVAIDEEHAYGAAQMRLAEAQAAVGRHDEALRALEVVERNHGPSPESAFRVGAVHRARGDKEAARASFRRVDEIAARAVGYQKRDATRWSLRAKLLSWL
jgi:tetratricopeptide (TPR) repeat protein